MLEQYRKDLPMEEKDILSGHDQMSKRKLLFVVAGAAFAFVFFLFLIGIFRSDADSLAVNESRPDSSAKETITALEEKLQTALARIDALEKAMPTRHDISPMPTLEASEPHLEQSALSAMPIASAEDAVAMTDQALRHFVHNEVQEVVAAGEIAKKKEDKEKHKDKSKSVTKSAKSKVKKNMESTALSVESGSPTYIVQKGDTLSKISIRYFGTANRWKAIYDANRNRIANIN
jgi:LysM repeat protein